MANERRLMIMRLTVSGFGRFEKEQSWDFGRLSMISGHNYQGKSTIANAIAFALTGAPFFGGRDLDRFHHPAQPLLAAELTVRTEDGKQHVIRRIRQDSVSTVAVDGAETTQARFAARFGSKELILSLLNPLYFAEVLGKDGRKLLDALLPPVSHDAVMARMSEHMRGILANESLGTPETYLKNRREELKSLENDRLVLSGRVEQTDASRASLQAERAKKQTELSHTKAALDPLLQKQAAQQNTAVNEEIAKLSAQYDAVQNGDCEKQRRALQQQLAEVQQKRYVSANIAGLQQLQTALEQQYTRFTDEQHRFTALQQKGICPTCLRRIDEAALPEIQQAFGARLQQIRQNGVTVRAQRDQLMQQEQARQKAFADGQAAAIQQLQTALDALPASDAESIKAKIKELSAGLVFGGLTEQQAAQLQTLSQAQSKLESELEQIDKMLSSLPNTLAQGLAALDVQIQATQDKIAAAKAYLAERAAQLLAPVQMPKAGLRLTEVLKESGELRDVFKLTYEGRDYTQLSQSERVRCGIEVASLLSRLSGCQYPLFVDNAESLCDLGSVPPAGQVILSRVVSGQVLQVQNMDKTQQKAG